MKPFFTGPDGPRALQLMVRQIMIREIAEALRGIPFMPFKGIVLAHQAYDDPAERTMSDVDLLVPPEALARALRALEARGYALRERGPWGHEFTLASPEMPLPIDLHISPFAPGRYRISTRDLFTRSSIDEAAFGLPVRIPDPYDSYALVIGHAVAHHRPERTRRDLEGLARRLDPARIARRLKRTGMTRAARYVSGRGGDPVVALARMLMRRRPETSWPPRLGRLLLNGSLIASVGIAWKTLAEREYVGTLKDSERDYQPHGNAATS